MATRSLVRKLGVLALACASLVGAAGANAGYRRSEQSFLVSLPEFPFQQGSSLTAAGINYSSLQAMQAMKELESLPAPHN